MYTYIHTYIHIYIYIQIHPADLKKTEAMQDNSPPFIFTAGSPTKAMHLRKCPSFFCWYACKPGADFGRPETLKKNRRTITIRTIANDYRSMKGNLSEWWFACERMWFSSLQSAKESKGLSYNWMNRVVLHNTAPRDGQAPNRNTVNDVKTCLILLISSGHQ